MKKPAAPSELPTAAGAAAALYAALPAVHAVADDVALASWVQRVSRPTVVAAVRQVLAQFRRQIASGEGKPGQYAEILREVTAVLDRWQQPPLCEVINGTGILIHTGLGRAPLSTQALASIQRACSGYTPLEIDLDSGRRGQRFDIVRQQLCGLTGAESALVVNNNAAALLLALNTLADQRQVIVSRGELIEIGGSFRLPEVMAASGAQLREVGTTNKTRVADYAQAIGTDTAALLKVHPSNYQVAGFTQSVEIAELAALGRQHQLPVIHDIGSGALFDLQPFGLGQEPVAQASVQAGADLVLFSGDKLLGGPQAGIAVGPCRLIDRMAQNPLARALRVDKLTLAALSATLSALGDPQRAAREVPLWIMAMASVDQLLQRAQRMVAMLPRSAAEVIRTTAYLGGGALPNQGIQSVGIALTSDGASEEQLARRLRSGTPPVVGRLQSGRLLIDLRAVLPRQDDQLVAAVTAALQP